MMGASTFAGVFGSVPAGDPDRIARLARAACQAGWAVVVCKPGSKAPMCTLTARQGVAADRAAQQAAATAGDAHPGRRRHPCGLTHAITDPAVALRVVGRLVQQVGHVNLGLELSASRLVCVDVDTASQDRAFLVAWSSASGQDETGRNPTVRSPGAIDSAGARVHSDGGHYWFWLPDGTDLPPAPGVLSGEGDWSLMWARRQVLVPPSVRPEGAYQLTGEVEVAPAWLLRMIHDAGDARSLRASTQREQAFSSDDPLERWSAGWSWPGQLPGWGWRDPGLIDGCGCPIWTAPGDHASPKSATAHEAGCAIYDTTTGWGPLHLWTDHPPEQLRGKRTWSRLNFVAAMEHDGSVQSAMHELDLFQSIDLGEVAGTPLDITPAPVATAESVAEQQVEGRRVRLTRADRIATKRVRWGWADRIPLGELTLIPGREGIGKSLFLAWMAAELTHGRLLGAFHGHPRPVLYAASEDSWEYTLAPRLIAAGADLSLVHKVDIDDERDDRLILPADCDRLTATAIEVQAAALMLDPIISLIDHRLSVNQTADLRRALEPLRRLAERAELMICALAHLNKTTDVDTLSKVPGARAWVEVARAAIGMAEDRDEGLRVASQIKNNLGRVDLPNLSYRVDNVVVATGDGPSDVGRLVWTGESEVGVDEVLSRRPDRRGRETSAVTRTVVSFVQDGDQEVDLETIYDEFPEIKRETIRTTLRRAVERGTLSNPRHGSYRRVDG